MRKVAAVVLALTLALALLSPSSGQEATGSTPAASGPPVLLRLKAGEFDPVKLAEAEVGSLSGTRIGLFVVQFTGPNTAKGLALLQRRAVKVGPYLPDRAYLVRVSGEEAAQLAQSEGVRAVVRFRPAWKLESSNELGEGTFYVEVFPGTLEEAKAEAVSLGATVIYAGEDGLVLQLDRKVAPALAQSEAIIYIEEEEPATLHNDLAAGLISISGSDQVWASGLSGHGQIVAVADSGLDTGDLATLHPDLATQVVATYARGRIDDWSDPHGHGTHVAGSVVGIGVASDGQVRGMAPEAQLVFQSLSDSNKLLTGIGDVYNLFAQAYSAGARILSNSWGTKWSYSPMARRVDEFAWDHRDTSILFSAGNAGDSLMTVTAPSTAKNSISVGATENNRPILGTPYADDPNSVARFSSRGTTPDGRVKPDLVAPGTLILSTKSSLVPPWGSEKRTSNLDPEGNLWHAPYDSYYEFASGTSMATPITAGAAALVRQYFAEVKHITPSASLVKAALINGAQDLGDGWMSPHQGWGRIDLTNTLYPENGRVNWHESEAHYLEQDDQQSYSFFVEASQILKVTLVWTDPAPTKVGASLLVNDLNLEVIAPNGKLYRGNCFASNRKTAATDCSADVINNVENVFIAAPEPGLYQVRVHGSQINEGSQPYSLVVSGKGLSNGGRIACTDTPQQVNHAGILQKAGTKVPPQRSQAGALALSSVGNNCAQAKIIADGRFNFGLFQPARNTWYNTSFYWPSEPWSSYPGGWGGCGLWGEFGHISPPPVQ